MKSTLIKKVRSIIILVVFIVFLQGWWCSGQIINNEDVAQMETSEKEALYNSIQGFVGHWWNGSDLYPDPCGWTPIQGVSCDFIDGLWYVTDLNIGPLHDNSLDCAETPEFRPQIFKFKHLKSLSFHKCFASNHSITLPTDGWANLGSSLESLEFRSNPSLIGPIPSSFGALQRLRSLVLIENGLTGNLASHIGSLRHLKRLVLSGNKFTGRVFDTIGNLIELLILDLSRNSLSGHIPTSIGYLKSLIKLDFSNNLLTGNIPDEFRNLKNLTLLDLRNNNISGNYPKSIEEMTYLQELVLSNNQIIGDIVSTNWEKLHNLMILDLSYLGLSGEIPSSMAKLTKLRYLGLNNNNLTGNLPHEFINMPCISAVYVNDNNLTGVLNYSERFYGRLGRRFKAWNNTNLCYVSEVIMSSVHSPAGVPRCVSGFSGPNAEVRNGSGRVQEEVVWVASDSSSSFGLVRHGSDGVWLVFMVEFFMMIFLWNFFK
ncbi:hypothetical protein vseg_001678 [Gypsophila vaccaria]